MPETRASDGVMNEETVRKLAQSMQIALTDDEVTQLTAELQDAVEHAMQVADAAIENVPPTSHPLPIEDVMRPDEVKEVLSLEEALQNAPEVTDGMFRVTSIMGGDES